MIYIYIYINIVRSERKDNMAGECGAPKIAFRCRISVAEFYMVYARYHHSEWILMGVVMANRPTNLTREALPFRTGGSCRS